MDVDQPRHHESARVIDLPIPLRPARRPGLGADIDDLADSVMDEAFALARLILGAGEQTAATDECVHGGAPEVGSPTYNAFGAPVQPLLGSPAFPQISR